MENNRIKPSVFLIYDTLYENYPNLKGLERNILVVKSIIFRLENNFTELEELKRKYSLCKELFEDLSF